MSLIVNLENYFRQKHSLPENFQFFRWSCLPLDGPAIYYELEGGLANSVYKSGPRKGRTNHAKSTNIQKFRMTVDEYRRLFSREVG